MNTGYLVMEVKSLGEMQGVSGRRKFSDLGEVPVGESGCYRQKEVPSKRSEVLGGDAVCQVAGVTGEGGEVPG
jgi:hypothetical protein